MWLYDHRVGVVCFKCLMYIGIQTTIRTYELKDMRHVVQTDLAGKAVEYSLIILSHHKPTIYASFKSLPHPSLHDARIPSGDCIRSSLAISIHNISDESVARASERADPIGTGLRPL
jgi:hypothetical protein